MTNDPQIVSQTLQDSMVLLARSNGRSVRDHDFAVAALFGLSSVAENSLPSSGNMTTGVSPDAKTVGIDGLDTGVALDDAHGAAVINSVFASGFDTAFIIDDGFSTDEFNFVFKSMMGQGCVLTPVDVSDAGSAIDAIQTASVSSQGCVVKCRMGEDATHFITSKVADLGQIFGVVLAILTRSTSLRANAVYSKFFATSIPDFSVCFINLRNSAGSWTVGAPVTECIIGMPMLRAAHDAGLLDSLFEACGCRLNVEFSSDVPADASVPDGVNALNMAATGWNQVQEPYLYMRGWPTSVPSSLDEFNTHPDIVRHLSRRIPPMTGVSRWTCYFPFLANESYSSTTVGSSGQASTASVVGMSSSVVDAIADAGNDYSFVTNDPSYGGLPQNYAVNRWMLNGYTDESSEVLLPWSENSPGCFKYDVIRNIVEGRYNSGYAAPGVLCDRGCFGDETPSKLPEGRRGIFITDVPFMNFCTGDVRSRIEPARTDSPRWPLWFQPDLESFAHTDASGVIRTVQLPSIWNDKLINFYVGTLDEIGNPTSDGGGFIQYMTRMIANYAKSAPNVTSENYIGQKLSRLPFSLGRDGNLFDYIMYDFLFEAGYDKVGNVSSWMQVIQGYGLQDEWLTRMARHSRWDTFEWNGFVGIQNILEAGEGRYGAGLTSRSSPSLNSISEGLRSYGKITWGGSRSHPMYSRLSLVVSLLEAEVFRLISAAVEVTLKDDLCIRAGDSISYFHYQGISRLDADTSLSLNGIKLVDPLPNTDNTKAIWPHSNGENLLFDLSGTIPTEAMYSGYSQFMLYDSYVDILGLQAGVINSAVHQSSVFSHNTLNDLTSYPCLLHGYQWNTLIQMARDGSLNSSASRMPDAQTIVMSQEALRASNWTFLGNGARGDVPSGSGFSAFIAANTLLTMCRSAWEPFSDLKFNVAKLKQSAYSHPSQKAIGWLEWPGGFGGFPWLRPGIMWPEVPAALPGETPLQRTYDGVVRGRHLHHGHIWWENAIHSILIGCGEPLFTFWYGTAERGMSSANSGVDWVPSRTFNSDSPDRMLLEVEQAVGGRQSWTLADRSNLQFRFSEIVSQDTSISLATGTVPVGITTAALKPCVTAVLVPESASSPAYTLYRISLPTPSALEDDSPNEQYPPNNRLFGLPRYHVSVLEDGVEVARLRPSPHSPCGLWFSRPQTSSTPARIEFNLNRDSLPVLRRDGLMTSRLGGTPIHGVKGAQWIRDAKFNLHTQFSAFDAVLAYDQNVANVNGASVNAETGICEVCLLDDCDHPSSEGYFYNRVQTTGGYTIQPLSSCGTASSIPGRMEAVRAKFREVFHIDSIVFLHSSDEPMWFEKPDTFESGDWTWSRDGVTFGQWNLFRDDGVGASAVGMAMDPLAEYVAASVRYNTRLVAYFKMFSMREIDLQESNTAFVTENGVVVERTVAELYPVSLDIWGREQTGDNFGNSGHKWRSIISPSMRRRVSCLSAIWPVPCWPC